MVAWRDSRGCFPTLSGSFGQGVDGVESYIYPRIDFDSAAGALQSRSCLDLTLRHCSPGRSALLQHLCLVDSNLKNPIFDLFSICCFLALPRRDRDDPVLYVFHPALQLQDSPNSPWHLESGKIWGSLQFQLLTSADLDWKTRDLAQRASKIYEPAFVQHFWEFWIAYHESRKLWSTLQVFLTLGTIRWAGMLRMIWRWEQSSKIKTGLSSFTDVVSPFWD